MSQDHFDKNMEEIKQAYNKIPPITSSKEIFQAIQQEKRKQPRFEWKNLSVIAATIGVFLIGGILIGSMITSNDQVSMGPPGQHGAVTGDKEGNGEDTGNMENNSVDESVNLDYSVARPDTLSKTYFIEGIEEQTVDYELYISESMRYSTYLYPSMALDGGLSASSGEADVETFVLNEYFTISVSRLNDSNDWSLADWEEHTISRYLTEGYELFEQEFPMFEEIERQGLLLAGDFHYYYAFLENHNDKYLVELELYNETLDGTMPHAGKLFVEELQFH